ncbi:MAG: prephenate dehydrogenase [Treponema sp.]|jgi:prephenate dehydrogenase|nr:prephenate dehydrogenase [Treponema sp.]
MKPIEECTAGIVGLGLMGGAIAMALKKIGPARLFACDINSDTLDEARQMGLIDQGWPGSGAAADEMLALCDLVYLCINPSTLLRFMNAHIQAFKKGALITDIAGVKTGITAAMEQGLRDDLDFIPGHPMAGSEKGGFANAARCSFTGKNYILTPLKRNTAENLEFMKGLIYRMGFGTITCVTAEEHDRKIAFTSQLCHVIAAALIDCEGDTEITRFGGGSFEDLTRIAMLNASMWTELFIENRTPLLERIEQFEGSLDLFKTLIREEREQELMARLGLVRERRSRMNG